MVSWHLREQVKQGNRLRITAVHTGIVMGLLAVLASTILEVRPPEAYGICMACHGRDLVNWVVNASFGTQLTVSQAALAFPLLTTAGVFLGAGIAANQNGEFRWTIPDSPMLGLIHGVVVMNCALLAAGCTIRLLLRASSGELLGLVGFTSLLLGASIATLYLRWRAER